MKKDGGEGWRGGSGILKARMNDLALACKEAALKDFIVHTVGEILVPGVPEMFEEGGHIGGVDLSGVGGDAGFEFGGSDEGDAIIGDDFLADLSAFDVAAGFGGEVNDDGASLHAGDHIGVEECGGGAAEEFGGGNDNIALGADLCHALALFFDLFGGEFLCVALVGLAGIAEVDFDKPGAEGFDLFLDDGPGIESLDAGTEAFGGGDSLEAGDADADDKDAGGGDGAGGGHHHGEDAVNAFGGTDDGVVAGEIGLGTERIHFLGEGGTRNHLHGDGVDPLAGHGLKEIGTIKRVEEADVEAAFRDAGDLIDGGGIDAEDGLGGGDCLVAIVGDGGSDFLVSGIVVVAGHAGSGFDGDLNSHGDQFFGGLRIQTDAGFAVGFLGAEKVHGKNCLGWGKLFSRRDLGKMDWILAPGGWGGLVGEDR